MAFLKQTREPPNTGFGHHLRFVPYMSSSALGLFTGPRFHYSQQLSSEKLQRHLVPLSTVACGNRDERDKPDAQHNAR